ncbi:MAG TPA: helix-turn-helix domain-containing protein [Gemmatimonadales bacterium]|jgi:AcrR family transcriptional regulator|nr:helix-turn-helix domain-containing protein [Gemmatimonadales bacterium]
MASPLPPRSPQSPPAADLTRQRLIRAALELFTSRGYHDTTTAEIARKAGVAEGTIYRHFRSKQQLWNELYRAALRWAAKLVPDADAGRDSRAQLERLAQALVEGAARDPAVVTLGLLDRHAWGGGGAGGGGGLLDDESRKTAREFHAALERVIAQGKADGAVRAGAVEVWAAVWLAVACYALEKIVAKEWKPGDGGVGLVIEGAWEAISA